MTSSPYSMLRDIKNETGVKNVRELLAMSPARDPFYCGTKGDMKKAEWFLALWDRFGYTGGVHLRRVHYQIVTHADITKPDGKLYVNDDASWEFLNNAAAAARYLGMVDPELVIDRRNPEPHLNAYIYDHPPVDWSPDWECWKTPSIDISMDLELPAFKKTGYTYTDDLQSHHIEVWAEKSTMNDILAPICRARGVNLVTGLGFMSISSVINFLKRVKRSGKPSVVLYISDFDISGTGMPRQVARQIEFWKSQYCPDLPIQLEPVVLTKDQVLEFIPSSHLNKIKGEPGAVTKFKKDFGMDGSAELDALESLHPGELGKIIKNAIDIFQDRDLQAKYQRARAEADEKLQTVWEDVLGHYEADIQDLVERIREVGRKHVGAFNAEVKPLLEELETLQQAVTEDLVYVDIDMPPLPDAEVQGLGREPYFDSSRSYMEQLCYYKNGNGMGS